MNHTTDMTLRTACNSWNGVHLTTQYLTSYSETSRVMQSEVALRCLQEPATGFACSETRYHSDTLRFKIKILFLVPSCKFN